MAAVALLVSVPSPSRAQAPVDASGLRVQWEAAPPASGLQAVCGRVFNDSRTDARRVRVRVEGLDERAGVVTRRDGEVLGQVSTRGLGRFCLTMAAGAASYRVIIIGVEWAAAAPESP